MKLRYLKRNTLIIQELGFKKCIAGDVIDAKDKTYAEMLIENYPGCFEIVVVPTEEKSQEEPQEKVVKGYKNKMAKNSSETKEFS